MLSKGNEEGLLDVPPIVAIKLVWNTSEGKGKDVKTSVFALDMSYGC